MFDSWTRAKREPFAFTAINLPKFNWRLRVASGLVSFVFRVVLIYGIGDRKSVV